MCRNLTPLSLSRDSTFNSKICCRRRLKVRGKSKRGIKSVERILITNFMLFGIFGFFPPSVLMSSMNLLMVIGPLCNKQFSASTPFRWIVFKQQKKENRSWAIVWTLTSIDNKNFFARSLQRLLQQVSHVVLCRILSSCCRTQKKLWWHHFEQRRKKGEKHENSGDSKIVWDE